MLFLQILEYRVSLKPLKNCRGYEQLYCDLLQEQDFLFALWDRLLELQKRFFRNYLSLVAPFVIAVGYADDLGMQDRPQLSPSLYRQTLKPYHQKIFSYIHSFGVKVMLHSCGDILPLMEDLIEAGVDIFNPVQTSAAEMDVHTLASRFGDRAVFWGGIDEQQVLRAGTTAEVRQEVRRVALALGSQGGYVLSATHNIQIDTPPANLLAMYDEARRSGGNDGCDHPVTDKLAMLTIGYWFGVGACLPAGFFS